MLAQYSVYIDTIDIPIWYVSAVGSVIYTAFRFLFFHSQKIRSILALFWTIKIRRLNQILRQWTAVEAKSTHSGPIAGISSETKGDLDTLESLPPSQVFQSDVLLLLTASNITCSRTRDGPHSNKKKFLFFQKHVKLGKWKANIL